MMALSVVKNYEVHQLDMKGAFIHAIFPEAYDIWIRLPNIPHVEIANGQIIKLRKFLSGLRQAPKMWYKLLSKTLGQLVYRRAQYSDFLFIGGTATVLVYIVSYVDNIMVFGALKDVRSAKRKIYDKLSVSDLGICAYFLGIKIECRVEGFFLSQSSYTLRVVEEANMPD